ncbi:hypothetical protein [Streptosporangium sp. NPDC051022]|uniref:hypothetical protein n=1 Tax=Streptosporangium sp. NPDC051022 TaxID=3155752 RepID=UPI003414F16C
MRLARPLLTVVLATLTAATAVVLAPLSSAWAGNGTLWINGKRHQNPSGCYSLKQGPLSATNRTNTAAVVYEGGRCNHRILGAVGPDQRGAWERAGSIYIN